MFRILFFLFFTTSLFAQQKGYTVYSGTGETYQIKKYVRKDYVLKFKVDGKTIELPYQYIDSITYFTKKKGLKGKQPATMQFMRISEKLGALMEIVERGKVTLYLYRYSLGGGISTNYYALREGELRPFLLATRDVMSPRNFIDDASEYFQDCPVLVEKIKNKEYKKKEAPEMVRFYNLECN